MGQFILPVLYMPLKRIFPNDFGPQPKYDKVTSHHVRTQKGWTLEHTYSQTMDDIKIAMFSFVSSSSFTAANLADLDYYWSYSIPFNEVNSTLSDSSFAPHLTPGKFQEELLKFISQKFVFNIDNVAATLGIPSINLWQSYDPDSWEDVVHAMVSESSSAFARLLELPSVNALVDLVDKQTQEFLNANLSRFEELVFPFRPKKAILDTKITSYLINSSGVIPGESYNDVTVAKVLQQHKNVSLSAKEFGILYNLTAEQAKAIGRATFYQIFRMCMISTDTLLHITFPELSWRVVGSMYVAPPCPVLIAIKGKAIASFENVFNPQNATVLDILKRVSNLAWRTVYEAVNASLPEWEFLDSITLPQLAEISGVSIETLLNDSVSEAVTLVFSIRADGTLNNATNAHRAFIRSLLEEKFNFSLSEVANLTTTPKASFQDATSPWLLRKFLDATTTYFGLNLSGIVFSMHVSEEKLYNLPRQEWKSMIAAIVDLALKSEATDLQMSAENLVQFLGVQPVELPISQLKELIKNQILVAKQKKRKLETDPISLYLSQNSVSDEEYLNSTVLALVTSASGFSSYELKLVYAYNSDNIFIVQSIRINDLLLYCALNTSTIKDRTPYNITAELVGVKEAPAVCVTTRFYLSARSKNMSLLQTEFSAFSNSSISFVKLVENVTGLSWRRNVWAFGSQMEAWTVLYVLSEDGYKEITTGLNLDPYLSKTLVQIFQKSIELQDANNAALRAKIQGDRGPTLNIIYELFNTDEEELRHFGSKTKDQYDVLFPIEVFSLVIQYLVGKFNVSVNALEASLDLKPGEVYKLSPTEWPEMIPFVKKEVIRSGHHQLSVTMSNFAQLLEETPTSLQSLTLAQLESKWDSTFSRLRRGKAAIETETLLQIITSIGIISNSLDDVTILKFFEARINVTKSEVLLLYSYSSIGIDVLGNYTFVELPGFCELSKGDLFNKRPHEIIVSLLGHDNDMSCRKIALVVAASSITVNELASKFSFEVKDNVSLLMMFEDLFKLPWPKIAWAVNASLPDWPLLGATNLSDVSHLTSQSVVSIRSQKSFREITMQLLGLSGNLHTQLLNTYRTMLISEAAGLFSINSSRICNNCNVVDILWNSLRQLNLLINFEPEILPNELNVSPYEFNLTLPSQWPLMVQPIVKDAYSRAAVALGMDRDCLSSLLQTSTAAVENMTLSQYQELLIQSIQPFMAAVTALRSTPISELIAAKGMNLSALHNKSIFDVIDAILAIPVQNISFIFNWTAEQQAKLKNYTLDDMSYYRGVELQALGSVRLFTLVEYIIQQSFSLRTMTPPTPPSCKRGSTRVSNDANCTGNPVFTILLSTFPFAP